MQFNQSISSSTKSPNNIPWYVTIIIAFALFFVGQILASLILVPLFLMVYPTATLDDLTTEPLETIFSLLTFPFVLLLCLLIHRFIYRHPMHALGFFKHHVIQRYLVGMVLGMTMISIIYFINLFAGAMHSTLASNINLGLICLLIFLFMIQGLTEEVVARGFLMNKISHQLGVPFGIIINSIFFSFLHFLNPNVSLLSFINLFLAGVVFSLLFYWSDNIWLTGAAHSFWNITLGVLIGNEVSGQRLSATLLVTESNDTLSLMNGGHFGLEGGLVVTVVSLCIICLLLKLCLNKYHQTN
ncbi:CPBP family intramembrane glutamic endopeptidase [Macrococcoides caseolyticum]|uniref:CPBP family intramembrane glutamic endopeptidase n=1 Tax=Macrococcoides caseolyticum TaxID=69966 RepID=UPI001F27EC70|nr:type II CAAX endopeptidase family protein [Macrococcus caseolyticus]MCE4956062.1 CPBP family intramembrane metalloprotease [Macrococcus caseolyticus]